MSDINEDYSIPLDATGSEPTIVRLDEIDRSLLRDLRANARTPNAVLADRAGVAASTALARVRALRESGVITGYHAEVDRARLGLGLSALIHIEIHPTSRDRMREIVDRAAALPNVSDVFLLGGDTDILVHVSCPSAAALRDFIDEHLADPAIANTRTSLVFEHRHR